MCTFYVWGMAKGWHASTLPWGKEHTAPGCGCVFVLCLFLLSVSGQTTVGQNCLKVHFGIGQQCLRRFFIHPVAFADVEETERVQRH